MKNWTAVTNNTYCTDIKFLIFFSNKKFINIYLFKREEFDDNGNKNILT